VAARSGAGDALTPLETDMHAATATRTLHNYVGGRWVPPSASATLDVTNPASGDVLAQVPLSNAADLDDAARAALPAWRAVTHRSNTIGLIVPHVDHPSYASIVQGSTAVPVLCERAIDAHSATSRRPSMTSARGSRQARIAASSSISSRLKASSWATTSTVRQASGVPARAGDAGERDRRAAARRRGGASGAHAMS